MNLHPFFYWIKLIILLLGILSIRIESFANMYVRNYARRLDIYVNSRLRSEMPDTSVFRLRPESYRDNPIEEEYRVNAKEAYIHIC